jgi:hypothetical protein
MYRECVVLVLSMKILPKQETWQCHETRFSIITIVDKYVVVEIQIQATNNVTAM